MDQEVHNRSYGPQPEEEEEVKLVLGEEDKCPCEESRNVAMEKDDKRKTNWQKTNLECLEKERTRELTQLLEKRRYIIFCKVILDKKELFLCEHFWRKCVG